MIATDGNHACPPATHKSAPSSSQVNTTVSFPRHLDFTAHVDYTAQVAPGTDGSAVTGVERAGVRRIDEQSSAGVDAAVAPSSLPATRSAAVAGGVGAFDGVAHGEGAGDEGTGDNDTPCSEHGAVTRQSSLHYELYAVLLHSGTLQKGHYFALIQDVEDGAWFMFDDDKVTELSDAQLQRVGAHATHMLHTRHAQATPPSRTRVLNWAPCRRTSPEPNALWHSAGAAPCLRRQGLDVSLHALLP